MAEYLAVANLLLFRLLIHLLLLAATAVVAGAILFALSLLVITAKQTLGERREKWQHKKKNEAVKKTKALMANYRAMQAYVDSQVQPEDLEGQEDTRRLLSRIDAALEQISQDYAAVGEDQKMVAFKLKYIEGKTYEQIAERLGAHENTPHNWINQVIKRLAVYLYGVQALR